MNIVLKNISGLEKVRSVAQMNELCEVTSATALAGETISYQLCCTSSPEKTDTFIFVDGDLKDSVDVYIEKYAIADCVSPHDDDVLMTEPGIIPDILIPLKDQNGRCAVFEDVTTLWINVNVPESCKSGKHTVKIRFENNTDRNDVIEKAFDINVINEVLPKQSTIYTQWLHADCIATAHNVPVYSEEHWALLEKYVTLARQLGINMILTPIITPPLDTEVGLKRLCTQLIKIEKTGEKYSFDFSLLDRWINMCQKCGMEYFEMSHLFSQWGLLYTANIKVKENGVESYMFDTRVKSTDPSYKDFLEQMLPELVKYLKLKGIYDKCFFHISDEPYGSDHVEAYSYGKSVLAPILGEEHMMDALSNVEYYEKGLVKNPVVSILHMEEFFEKDIENRWGYYCCAEWQDVSNRFLAMPSYRNRIIGLQIYKFNLCGFLHWGYNFYNSQVSRYLINPYMTSSADRAFPSGDAFTVYPMKDGPVPSLRGFIFKEALSDVDVCKTLEKYIGREAVIKLIDEEAGFDITFKKYPRNAQFIPALMEKMKKLIASYAQR